MDDNILEVAYIFNNTEGIAELTVPANDIKQRNGWVLALYDDKVIGGAKEEYLKAFYLRVSK